MNDRIRVIVIEDDENFAQLIGMTLTGLIEPISIVDNWEAAFEMIESERHDVAWADLRMPMSHEAETVLRIAHLRKINPDIVIIVGSGYLTPALQAELHRAGTDGIFFKGDRYDPKRVATLIVLGLMRVKKRSVKFNDQLLLKALQWMEQRFPEGGNKPMPPEEPVIPSEP